MEFKKWCEVEGGVEGKAEGDRLIGLGVGIGLGLEFRLG